MKYYFLFVAVAMLSFIGCEDKVQAITTKNPYAKFSATYDAATNNSTGTVFLTEGSKSGGGLYIDKDEQLLFQDKTMQYQTANRSYTLSLVGYSVLNTFKLVDLKKSEFVNTIVGNNIAFPIDAQYNRDTVNTSFPVILKWIGSPIDTNESVTVTIEDKVFKQDTLSATSITIPETGMTTFKGKSILTSLERYKERGLQQKPGTDGLISYLYKATPRKITFKEGSAPLSNKNIYAEFAVVYDGSTNISTGSLQFREGSNTGAIFFIDASASAKFQTTIVQLESATNRYSGTITGFLSQYDFRYVDIDKKEFLNVITGNTISLPLTLPDTVNTASPLKISWSETGVGTSEKVTVRILDKSFVQDTLSAKSISIAASELAVFKGTSQKVYIERLKTTSLQQKIGANGSGSISNRYIALPKTVVFK